MERFEVPPQRLERWLARWTAEHGDPVDAERDGATIRYASGVSPAVLVAEPPFGVPEGLSFPALVEHAAIERRVGVLLVRLGGYAAGVFEGDRLLVSKVGSRLVHGRHKKGGSSANRFRRRRENEVTAALAQAADVAARILLGSERFDHLVLGGDRSAATTVMADARLAPLRPLLANRFLTVPDPRRVVLDAAPDAFRATILRSLPADD